MIEVVGAIVLTEKEFHMEKFIPYEKLSKKERQKVNKARRVTWGDVNPVTRKPEKQQGI